MTSSYKAVHADRIEYRSLEFGELVLIRDIDRTEQIDALYVQHGTRLDVKPGDRSAPPWTPDSAGEHSVASQLALLERWVSAGSIALGAFSGVRLVGIGVVASDVRPGLAQLAYLHVSNGFRSKGIGGRLSDELERIAREAGATSMVVSATPSLNTVDFYRRRGFEPTADPLPELLELEPDDVHMAKSL